MFCSTPPNEQLLGKIQHDPHVCPAPCCGDATSVLTSGMLLWSCCRLGDASPQAAQVHVRHWANNPSFACL